MALELDPAEHRDLRLHKGLGCPACFQTGYLGRTGIFEIMVMGEELRDLDLPADPQGCPPSRRDRPGNANVEAYRGR